MPSRDRSAPAPSNGFGTALGFAALYMAAILLGHLLSLRPSQIATVWPAAGVYLAALLLSPRSRWPLLLGIASLVNLGVDAGLLHRPVPLAAGFALANACEAIGGVLLLRALGRTDPRDFVPGLRLADSVSLCLVALAAPLIGAAIGATFVDALDAGRFEAVFWVWWRSSALGAGIAAPLVLMLLRPASLQGTARRVERLPTLLVVAIIAGVVFGLPPSPARSSYLVLPCMLWVALRCGPGAGLLGVAIVALLASGGTAAGLGPFSRFPAGGEEQVALLQVFLCVVAGATLLLVSTNAERERAHASLAGANAGLEAAVEARTRELTRANQALLAREAELAGLVDASPIGMLRAGPDGRVLAANDAFLRLKGRSRAELEAGLLRWDHDGAAQTGPRGERLPRERSFVRADGARIPVLVSEAQPDPGTGIVTVFVVDLTEWRRGQETLRERAELLEATSDFVLALDRDWTITFINRRAIAGIGQGRDLRGNNLWELFPDAVGTPFWDAYRRSMDERVTCTVDAFYPPLQRHYQAESHPSGDGGIVLFFRDVTDERRAAELLAESEARWRALVQVSPQIIWVADPDGRLTFASAAWWELTGLDEQESLGTHAWLNSVLPESRLAFQRGWREARADAQRGGSGAFEAELCIRCVLPGPSGGDAVPTGRWHLCRARPERDEDGSIVRWIGVAFNIHGRRTAEARLRDNEARMAAVLEALPVGVVLVDGSGRVLRDNAASRELRGAARTGDSWETDDRWICLWPDSGTPIGPGEWALDRALATGEVVRGELVEAVRAGSGVRRFFLNNAAPVRDARGTVIGAVAAELDVTERRAAEAALAESEERFRTIFDAIDEGYSLAEIVLDAKGQAVDYRFLEVNALFETMTGIQGAVGRTILELVPQIEQHWIETYARVATDGETLRFEQRSEALGRWYDVFATPVGAQGRFATIFKDITARREAEALLERGKLELERQVEERTAALRESEARLAQAARMEALGRLAGGIAHDFNNVLQAVQSGLALAQRRLVSDPDKARHFLDLAAESAERGAAVTARLLSFSRRGELSATAVDPAPLLQGIVEILGHTMGGGVTFRLDCAPDLPPAHADLAQLESVLVNLANNARDALPDGKGTIAFTAAAATIEPGDSAQPAAVRPALEPGRYVRFAVADDGEGMSPAVLARVTEPFFTTKPLGKGTGLGLAMARGFAEQSKGALAIESELGRGTTVSLWLPVAPHGAADKAGSCDPRCAARDEPQIRASLLVVDDEAGLREMLSAGLGERGHAVQVASDAQAALSLLERGGPIDLLVTDLTMPGGLDGLALIREARRMRPGLPAILVTGHFGDATRGALQAASGDAPSAVLRKPVAVEGLEAQILALLHSPVRRPAVRA